MVQLVECNIKLRLSIKLKINGTRNCALGSM